MKKLNFKKHLTLEIALLFMVLFSSCSKNLFAPDSSLSLVSETMEVQENQDHTVSSGNPIGDINFSVTKSDKINGVTFTLLSKDAPFELRDNLVYPTKVFNYEEDKTEYPLKVQAQTGNGHVFQAQIMVKVLNENEKPYNIGLSNTNISMPFSGGYQVGTLSAKDTDEPKTPQVFTYKVIRAEKVITKLDQIVKSDVTSKLQITQDKLQIVSAIFSAEDEDFMETAKVNLRLRVTDQGGLFYEKDFVLSANEGVTELPPTLPPVPTKNTAPRISYNGLTSVTETTPFGMVGLIQVMDDENNAELTEVTIEYWPNFNTKILIHKMNADKISAEIIHDTEFDYYDVRASYLENTGLEVGTPTIKIHAIAKDYEFETSETFNITIDKVNNLPTLVLYDDFEMEGSGQHEIKLDGSDLRTELTMEEAPNTRTDGFFNFSIRALDQDRDDILTVKLLSIDGLTNQDKDGWYYTDFWNNPVYIEAGGFVIDEDNTISGSTLGTLPTGQHYSILEGELRIAGESRFAAVCYQNRKVKLTMSVSDGKDTVVQEFNVTILSHGSMQYFNLDCAPF